MRSVKYLLLCVRDDRAQSLVPLSILTISLAFSIRKLCIFLNQLLCETVHKIYQHSRSHYQQTLYFLQIVLFAEYKVLYSISSTKHLAKTS